MHRPVGQAFMPLASTPAIQQMVLDDSARGEGARSHSLPHRPRPERSVRLMRERCDNYGGRSGFNALPDDPPFHGASLEDAFPARRGGQAVAGSLEDAFPPRQGACGARGIVGGGGLGGVEARMQLSLEEHAFPPQQRGGRGSLEDAFPPQSGGGSSAAGSLEDAFPSRQGGEMASFGSRAAGRMPPRPAGGSSGPAARPLIRRSGSRPNSGSGASTPQRPGSGSRG